MKIKVLIVVIIVGFAGLISLQRIALKSLSEKAAKFKASQSGTSEPSAQAASALTQPQIPKYLPLDQLPTEQAEPGFAADFNLMLLNDEGKTFYKLIGVVPTVNGEDALTQVETVPCAEFIAQAYSPSQPVCTQLVYPNRKAVLARLNKQLDRRFNYRADQALGEITSYNLSGWPQSQTTYNGQNAKQQELFYSPSGKLTKAVLYENGLPVELVYEPSGIRVIRKNAEGQILSVTVYAMDHSWINYPKGGQVPGESGRWESNVNNQIVINGTVLFPTQFGWPDPKHYCQSYPDECVAKYLPGDN